MTLVAMLFNFVALGRTEHDAHRNRESVIDAHFREHGDVEFLGHQMLDQMPGKIRITLE